MTISRAFVSAVALVAMSTLAACSRKDETAALDQALRNDLSLASQAQPYQPQMYVSPTEQGYGYAPQGYYPQGYYPQQGYPPQYVPQPYYPQGAQPVVYRSAPAPRVIRRAPASAPVYSSGSAGSSDGVYGSAPEVSHTKRDAIIGAAAGAAIGVASTRNTLKGAIIGAAAGGLLGAVYGEKIDGRRR